MDRSFSGLQTRIISALLAGGVTISAGYFGGPIGLSVVVSAIILIGIIEFTGIGFLSSAPLNLPTKFLFISIALFIFLALSFLRASEALAAFSLAMVFYLSALLWTHHKGASLENIRQMAASSLMGFFYAAFLPSFAVRTLVLPDGMSWFILLLVAVFAGDTGAYFAGLNFGKKRLMPSVSPQKTIAGAWGGLVGSALGGLLVGYWFFDPTILLQIVVGSTVAGFFAQCGDLFESLLKRVSGKKDSGSIMPGHGGVLDRLDGVYFAAPAFFVLARWIS